MTEDADLTEALCFIKHSFLSGLDHMWAVPLVDGGTSCDCDLCREKYGASGCRDDNEKFYKEKVDQYRRQLRGI